MTGNLPCWLSALLLWPALAAAEEPRVLDWRDPAPIAYPRLFIEPGKAAEFRDRLKAAKARYEFAAFPPTGHPNTHALVFLATGLDTSAEELLVPGGPVDRLEAALSDKPDRPTILQVVNDLATVDWLLSWKKLPPEVEAKLRRTLAKLGYELADPKGKRPALPADFGWLPAVEAWSAVAVEMIADLLPSHPAAAQWTVAAADKLAHPVLRGEKVERDYLWLSPAVLAPRLAQEALVMQRKTDAAPDALLRDQLASLARRSTPFDSVRRARTLFGSPSRRDPRGTVVFGWAAAVYAKADIPFAREMAWWHEQFGEMADSDAGAIGPLAESALITLQLADRLPQPRVPALTSGFIPGFGLVVRDDAPSPAELYVAVPDSQAVLPEFQYFHQAVPVCRFAAFNKRAGIIGHGPSGNAEPAPAPPAPSPDAGRGLSVMRFAEYAGLERSDGRQEVLVIKSPVAAAPQYVLYRAKLAKGNFGLHLDLPGSKYAEADGQLLNSYAPLDAAVTARVLQPAELKFSAKPLETRDAGMPWVRLTAEAKDAEEILVLVFPYSAGNPMPTIKPIADGRGAEVKARGSTQWVFLSDKPVKFESVTADFEGRVGAVREAPAVTSVQIFGGGKARSKNWTVETDGTISVLQRGLTTLEIQSDGPAQELSITWKRIGGARPEAIIDDQPLTINHEGETTTVRIPAGKHKIRMDFDH